MVDDIPSEAAIVQVIEQGPAIPAVSTSGMVVLIATVLAAGGCLIRRRQRHSTV